MTTDNFINENKTENFKKGDKVVMHGCYEATFEKYKDKVWICQTDSYLDRAKQDVVFLEDFSGCFASQYLKPVAYCAQRLGLLQCWYSMLVLLKPKPNL